MKNKTSLAFMAIAAGRESTEGASIKRYIGIAPVFVLAVNPTREGLEKLYGIEIEKDPVYVGTTTATAERPSVPNVRLDFIVKSDAEKCKQDFTTKVSIFVSKEYQFNKDKTKCKVIDKYGRTAWVTSEQFKVKAVPVSASGKPLQIDSDYRMAYAGEEALTNFIKAYLNIPDVMIYAKGEWVPNPKVKPEDCECRLDSIDKYFEGDFSEIQGVISMQPNNKIKVLFGIKTTDDNKQFQTAYTEMFLKNNTTNYSRLDKELQDRKEHGAYSKVEFKVADVAEYDVTATTFPTPGATPAAPLPFTPTEGTTPW